MQSPNSTRRKNKRGSALVTTLGILMLLSLAAASYLDSSTKTIRASKRNTRNVQTTHLCEAGLQTVQRALWRPFRQQQKFVSLQTACAGASNENPVSIQSGSVPNVGNYTAGVIGYTQVNAYNATAKIKSVGYIDSNKNGQLDSGEPFKTVIAVTRFELARSQVFDYTYFVNNYGWMDGFGVNDLIVNGDMRANGNFDFLNGSPTINGSVIACANDKLDPKVPGFINMPPVKWTDSDYLANWNNSSTPSRDRWRPPYQSAVYGATNSATFNTYRDEVFSSNASWINGQTINGSYVPPGQFGSVMADSRGMNAWTRTSVGQTPVTTILDTKPTKEVVMPDLSDLATYQTLSKNFGDNPAQYQKSTFADGTTNPNYGSKAFVEVWNSSTSSYQRLSDSNGQVSGSAVLVGTSDKPIKIYGPVTISQDVVIKGYIQGQGTLYAGRNVHIVGSIKYKNGPSWLGSNPAANDLANEKKDMLGLAARGSVIMGDPTTFANPYPLYYMMPPFTKGRYDDNGNYIPAYNAMDTDSTGKRKYQSVVSDSTIHGLSEGVNQIDAILYTNYVGGGNVGTSGSGVTFNGTIVCKDESIVTWSLPIRMNYDNRIRERGPDTPPLIDLQLPRQPTLMRSTWQDKGYIDPTSN